MEQKSDFVLDIQGRPVSGASVLVLDENKSKADIYDISGNTVSNPIVTSRTGKYSFFAKNGKYYLQFIVKSQVVLTLGPFTLYDPDDDDDRNTVNVKSFGAKGDGIADDQPAIQAATNTGKVVHFPEGTYRMGSAVLYNGPVFWQGRGPLSKIRNDDIVLQVQNGGGSKIDNLYAENITAPWIIYRDPDDWTKVPVPVKSNGPGYQPTINDEDIWSGLTSEQKNQDIGPKFLIHGDSDIVVSRIYGRFVTVWVYDAVRSSIEDCIIQGGKNNNAALMFWNVDGQIGYLNKAKNNVVAWPSFSGVSMARNYDGLMQGNIVDHAGESGLKTCQNFSNGVIDLRCRRMLIQNNKTRFCYYDGFDISSDYPHTGTLDVGHRVIGNDTYKNRQTGFYGDGKNVLFATNAARECGLAGVELFYNDSEIETNLVDNCNRVNLPAANQFNIAGDNNKVANNKTRRVVSNGYGLYAPGKNITFNNFAQGCANFFGPTGSSTYVSEGNLDISSGFKTMQAAQFVLFNNGGTIQHLFKSENVVGIYGSLASRFKGSNSTLVTTPTGTDSTTGFSAGAKISSASPNVVVFDTAVQDATSFEGVATVERNQTGVPISVQIGIYNSNINGVTAQRLGIALFNSSNDDPIMINPTTIPQGKAICIRFYGRLS